MRILIVTDAWSPQVNGVVRTLNNTVIQLEAMGHEVELITPNQFKTFPCPTYPEIRLAWRPKMQIRQRIERFDPDYLHIATEGPLGWAARSVAIQTGRPFTTAYHTRFPEYIHARFGIPLSLSYALFRHFHRPASAVMVATPSVEADLQARGFQRIKRWSRGVDLKQFDHRLGVSGFQQTTRPVFLFAGRVAVEKNIEAFLQLDLPGDKWVAGDGPQRAELQAKYPEVRWLGMLSPSALAAVYVQATVFVFPSLTDTFGLVMLEAMACGLPVAAFPVAGPVDVIGQSPAGALDWDLRAACIRAMSLQKTDAIAHANRFTWESATAQFFGNLQRIDRKQVVHHITAPAPKALPNLDPHS